MIIDTHSHIHGKEFVADIADVIQRSIDAGVGQIGLVGVDPADVDRALALAAKHPDQLFVIAGVHPHEASKWNADARDRLAEQVRDNPTVIRAVGEMGLDYHYDFAPKEAQRAAFIGQMELARETDLPIVIHCREAYDDCLAMLKDFYGAEPVTPGTAPRGVLHCYFGTLEQANQAIELGFMLGVGGSCTFKNAQEVHHVVTETSLEYLVLETDAPYMAPVPYRGKRNESSYLANVAARIAELKEITSDQVMDATTDSATRLYRL